MQFMFFIRGKAFSPTFGWKAYKSLQNISHVNVTLEMLSACFMGRSLAIGMKHQLWALERMEAMVLSSILSSPLPLKDVFLCRVSFLTSDISLLLPHVLAMESWWNESGNELCQMQRAQRWSRPLASLASASFSSYWTICILPSSTLLLLCLSRKRRWSSSYKHGSEVNLSITLICVPGTAGRLQMQ